MPTRRQDNAILQPNLGLYLDRPALAIPRGALRDGLNFRVQNGRLSNLNLGWEPFGDFEPLNGPVTLIDNFFIRTGAQVLIFGTTKDLYRFNEIDESVSFITPTYSEGTVTVTNNSTTVTGSGTEWLANLKEGDEIAFGASDIRDPEYDVDGGWYVIDEVVSDTELTLERPFEGSTAAGEDYTGRQLFTAFIEDFWDTAIFFNDPNGDDVWFATNGRDDIVKFRIADDEVTPMPELGFTCKTLATYKSMMIYANITDDTGDIFPNTIINSNPGEPENVATGLASQFIVHDGVDPINALTPLGDNLVIYAERTSVLTQFIGEPFIFAFRVAVAGIGPIAGRLVADFGDFHEFIGQDSQYRFDGVTIEEIGFQVFREVLRQQDPQRRRLGYAHFDEENGDLLWVIPMTIDPDEGNDDPRDVPPSRAWVSHYLEDAPQGMEDPISTRDFPFTASGFFERQTTLTWDQLTVEWQELNFRWNDQFFLAAFPFNLVGDAEGRIFIINTTQFADGEPLESFVRSGRFAVGDGRMRGLVSRIYPFVRPFVGDLRVQLFLTDHASGTITEVHEDLFDQTLPEGGHFVTPYRRARYAEIGFRTDDGTPWLIEGWDTDIRIGGRR
jgi:hypothetical protein